VSCKISVNIPDRRIEIDVFSYDIDIHSYFLDVKKAVIQIKSSTNHFDILADFSKIEIPSPVMSRSMADASVEINQWCMDQNMRKSASILNSELFKMQLRRITGASNFGFFCDRDSAVKWLLEE
jgi:hypothetical protein